MDPVLLWTHRDIDAAPAAAWALLTDPDRWPEWGPSVRGAALDGPFESGTTGRVWTSLGPTLPFTLTEVVDGERWAWRVLGIPATAHSVAPTGGGCRVGFGVPAPAAPYLVICRVALAKIDSLLTDTP